MLTLIAVASYLIGSVPWCWLVVFWFGRGPNGERLDLRNEGSGNVGASNAMRTLGWKWYLPLIIMDASKGFLPVWFTYSHLGLGVSIAAMAALCAVTGHCFPIFLKFKRGKGISITLGTLVAFGFFPEIGVGLAVGLFAFILSKWKVSVASLTAAAMVLATIIFRHHAEPEIVQVYILIITLVFVQHRDNIARLIRGEEPGMTLKKAKNLESI